MKPLLILLALLLTISSGKTQSIALDGYKIDSIHLLNFSSKKVIAYKLNYVTVYFSQNDCKKDCRELFKVYHCEKPKGKRVYTNEYRSTDYGKRKILLDSIYDLLHIRNLSSDTIFIDEKAFQAAGLRGFDIGKYLDNSQCVVVNQSGIPQSILIRQRGSWYRGPLAAWGGRRYFLPGFDLFFYQETDWIS
jgi:hypothetical protein